MEQLLIHGSSSFYDTGSQGDQLVKKEEDIKRVAEGTWSSIVVGSEEVMRVVGLEQRRSCCPLVEIWGMFMRGAWIRVVNG